MTTKILGDQITDYTINTQQFSNTAIAEFVSIVGTPKILYANVTSNTYTTLDDTAVDLNGGFIKITGSGFSPRASVLVANVQASAVTFVSSTTLNVQVPARPAGTYPLYVVNPDGGTGIRVAGITYSGSPIWVTTSPLAGQRPNTFFGINLSATGANTYSLANGQSLPAGTTLSANGYFSGNVSVSTTYSFDVVATDAELQDSSKTFSLTVVPYTIDYLVVGAGGSGGSASFFAGQLGGGGAGGVVRGQITVVPGTPFTMTVGVGVAGTSQDGNPSALSSPIITTITALGGGGGGFGGNFPAVNGRNGGSGGGGFTAGTGTQPTQNPGNATILQQYGNNGGPGGPPYEWGGGGGGAGGAGVLGTNANTAVISGGAGYTWPFTSNTYAVGGPTNATAWFSPVVSNGSPGTNGRGNGGQAGSGGYNPAPGWLSPANGGTGGSGVVILALPTDFYPGLAPGATVTTPPAAPGKTVLTYTSPGTYTA
jgi:hypothetical protein